MSTGSATPGSTSTRPFRAARGLSTPSELPSNGSAPPGVRGRAGPGRAVHVAGAAAGYRRHGCACGNSCGCASCLHGDGRSTPRSPRCGSYASRSWYRDRYLPEPLPRDRLRPGGHAVAGPAPPADFLGLARTTSKACFDSDRGPDRRVAPAQPTCAPAEDALDRLGELGGHRVRSGLPAQRRREHLVARRGELCGRPARSRLQRRARRRHRRAVRRGEVVAVEDFRFRRTLATILGPRRSTPTTSAPGAGGQRQFGGGRDAVPR